MSNNSTCYTWEGAVSTDIYCGIPSLSTCCGLGWDCLSNGLCRQHGTTGYAQGSCTEQNFQNCLSICNQGQFDDFTEVSRCDPNGNSWCCAGAAGQDLGGPTCCDTTLTTSLEPYPFSAIDRSGQSTPAGTSVSSTATPSTSSPSGTISTSAPTAPSTTAFTRSASLINPTSSVAPTVSQTSTTVPTSSAQSPPARQKNDATMEITVGVLLAIIVVFLGVFAFFVYQNSRKYKLGLVHLQHEMEAETLPYMPEMDGDGPQLAAELDITHYELKQPDTPRHELG